MYVSIARLTQGDEDSYIMLTNCNQKSSAIKEISRRAEGVFLAENSASKSEREGEQIPNVVGKNFKNLILERVETDCFALSREREM
jgi:hypothetical protein